MKNKKSQFTLRYIKDLIERSIEAIENTPKDSPLDLDFSTSYIPDIDRFDLPTVKLISSQYDTADKDYRIELSILFKNNLNIDRDYLVLEVWDKDDTGCGKQ